MPVRSLNAFSLNKICVNDWKISNVLLRIQFGKYLLTFENTNKVVIPMVLEFLVQKSACKENIFFFTYIIK